MTHRRRFHQSCIFSFAFISKLPYSAATQAATCVVNLAAFVLQRLDGNHLLRMALIPEVEVFQFGNNRQE